ncbi:MAG: Xaa-Pro aminopeptidase [Bradymonadia bacterium]|jgi:Xaa-Pro aminopeptidase
MNFAQRRRLLGEQMKGGALVLPTNPEQTRSNDTNFPFRPNSDLLYLSGFPEPEAVLVLLPGHPEHESVLFVLPKDREKEIWEGFRYGPEGAVAEFGVDAAFTIDELDEVLPKLLKGRPSLYYSFGQEHDEDVLQAVHSLRASRKTPDYSPQAIVNPLPLLHRMRVIKDADEHALMARAGQAAAEAHVAAMKATRPGMNEYEIDALLTAEFRKRGGSGPAYTSIVASGANACCLHYTQNNSVMRDGDLVLIDAGCELDWYAADITRTFPVGKRFSGVQKDIYQVVLEAEIAGIEACRPGISNHELQAATIRQLTQGMVDLGLLTGDVDGLVESKAHQRFYMHGVGHHIGLDVHDPAFYYEEVDVGVPITAGSVITIEPGIYVPADDMDAPEAMRGIGIRIEDDVIFTDGDPRVLTSGVPKSVAEIEAIREEALS